MRNSTDKSEVAFQFTIRSANLSSFPSSFVSHPQIVRHRHPAFRNATAFFLSLATFNSNLRIQNSTLLFGIPAYRQPRCRCQKQPCTKTTVRYFGRTISGLPGNSLLCKRYRNPRACKNFLTVSSGVVFSLRTRDISQLRRFADNRSIPERPPLTSNCQSDTSMSINATSAEHRFVQRSTAGPCTFRIALDKAMGFLNAGQSYCHRCVFWCGRTQSRGRSCWF